MEERKNSLPIISLVICVLGWFLMMSATPFNTSLINMASTITVIGLICGIVSIFSPSYKKLCAIIGIIFCIVSFILKDDLDDTRNSSITYNSEKDSTATINSSASTYSNTNNYSLNSEKDSTTTINSNTSTNSSTNNYPQTSTQVPSTQKNYQQIYNEYSQKLINAGPTSSINEMATIVNEGIGEMAQYMYSASGTDGQYATYQSWVDKLYDVYINNCR